MTRRGVLYLVSSFPTEVARQWMVAKLLPRDKVAWGEGVSYETVAAQTDGYSGADLTLVCKEAAMRPLRRLLASLDGKPEAVAMQATPGPVTADDLAAALRNTRPTVAARERYEQWSKEFGSA